MSRRGLRDRDRDNDSTNSTVKRLVGLQMLGTSMKVERAVREAEAEADLAEAEADKAIAQIEHLASTFAIFDFDFDKSDQWRQRIVDDIQALKVKPYGQLSSDEKAKLKKRKQQLKAYDAKYSFDGLLDKMLS